MLEGTHYIVIDGVPSSDFGVYVTNAGSYKVPEKDYELKSVNGRNGAIYLDYGRWENVDVRYPAFVVGDFQKNFDGFIAFLMSKNGYFRISDTIRPDVFREGIFTGEVSAKATPEGKQGTFEIEFSCKPQKWLVSGEERLEEPSSGIWYVNNTTRFPSRPLLEIYGYGTLWMNGYSLDVKNIPIGRTEVVGFNRMTDEDPESALDFHSYYSSANFNSGDEGYLDARWWVKFRVDEAKAGTISLEQRTYNVVNITTVDDLGNTSVLQEFRTGNIPVTLEVNANGIITVGVKLSGETFDMVTSSVASVTKSETVVIRVHYTNQSNVETYVNVTINLDVTVKNDEIVFSNAELTATDDLTFFKETRQVDSFVVDSTVSSLGNPMYVDMETGDAYKYVDEQIVYVNHAIWVGEELPVLNPGKTMIVPDENMTVYIIPRWWTL